MASAATQSRCNRQIRVREVRVIGADGEQAGIMATQDALQMAMDLGLDLVEVAPNSRPPVCKIMDYGRYKYQLQKKQQEARRKQSTVQIKEIKVRPKTDDHDFNTKLKHVLRFLEGGDRVKVTVFFRGREIVHKDRGMMILQRMVEAVGDLAKVEQQPRSEGRTMSLLLAPIKLQQP
ncbi:translation initiation factor IF-3 [Desulfovibrio ferrophilus]|uniref:translation initiation factor IF-3 n=1 Tax=Desulfovibrio ferrophilus TaxID=241368 RepID=UPI000F83D8EC|nr:translation initiation factor IF-3 [Desulfovibrio ferrophilus]